MVNIGLFVSGLAAIFSGLTIQGEFHMGNHGHVAGTHTVCGMGYEWWTDFHKVSIVVLSLLMIYHLWGHWKWYKLVLQKGLWAKNRQVLILSVLFFLVALTGFVPWFIDSVNGDHGVRMVLIEIHDKLTIVFSIFLILHIIRRFKLIFLFTRR